MFRKLQITATCLCFILFLALFVLWVRSHPNFDHLRYRGDWIYLELFLERGQFYIQFEYSPKSEFQLLNDKGFIKHALVIETNPVWNGPKPSEGYEVYCYKHQDNRVTIIKFRYWLPTITFSLLALLLKPKPRFRVSLREVLLLITIAAVTAGAITAAFRLSD